MGWQQPQCHIPCSPAPLPPALPQALLDRKRRELRAAKERLVNGVEKIAQASAQVADLQMALKEEQVIVEEKKAATDNLIVSIGK